VSVNRAERGHDMSSARRTQLDQALDHPVMQLRFAHGGFRAVDRHLHIGETAVEVTLIAKDPESEPGGSPTLYRTDRESWAVQDWVVTDPVALAAMTITEGESTTSHTAL